MKGDVKTAKTNSIVNYFQGSYQELRKVTWPTRHQAIRLTFLVLGFCLVAAAIVGALDLVFNYGYRTFVNLAPPAAISTDVVPSTTSAPAQPVTVTPTGVTTTPVSITDKTTPPSTTTPASNNGVTVTPIGDGKATVGGTPQ